jgi:hypothetical protein
MAKSDSTLFTAEGEPLAGALARVTNESPYHAGQYSDLLAAWQSYQNGTENPIQGSYGKIISAQLDCYQQLYRLVWHGWDPIKAGLGSLCPDTPGELLELLVMPDPHRHHLKKDPLLALLRGTTPQNAAIYGNLRRKKAEILEQAEAGAILAAVLEIARRATRGRGSLAHGTLKLALKEFARTHALFIRRVKSATKSIKLDSAKTTQNGHQTLIPQGS